MRCKDKGNLPEPSKTAQHRYVIYSVLKFFNGQASMLNFPKFEYLCGKTETGVFD